MRTFLPGLSRIWPTSFLIQRTSLRFDLAALPTDSSGNMLKRMDSPSDEGQGLRQPQLSQGAPPKVILLQTGNCSTDEILSIIRRNAIRLAELGGDAQRALLILR